MADFTDAALAALQLLAERDPALWAIVGRSLAVSATACALACALGLVLGAWLGVARFRGPARRCWPCSTPGSPCLRWWSGLLVYLLLSRSGPLGFLGWLFSFQAMVLAQALLVLPVVMALTAPAGR